MDADILARENTLLKARLAEVEVALAEAQEANRRLEDILRSSQRAQFGKRSEKLSPDQLNLALEDAELAQGVLEAAQEKAEAALRGTGPQARKPRRNRGHLPPHLPRVERVIEPASTTCPCGCGEMTKIGEDVSERLDVIPAQFRVLVTRRPKYACRRCSQAVAQAHAPEHVVPGGLPTELLIAWIIVSKFGDHLPFYRQAAIYRRQGIALDPRHARQLGRPRLFPPDAGHRPHAGASAGRRPHLRRRNPCAGAGPRPQGHQERLLLGRGRRRSRPWRRRPAHRAVPLRPRRGKPHPLEFLTGYRGQFLQCDAYQSYDALTDIARDTGPWQLVYCWTHVRRRFVKRFENERSPIAEEMLRQIALLYQVEKTVRGKEPSLRLAARRDHSAPVVAALEPWLEAQLSRIPQKSQLAEDIRYTLAHWPGLIRFLDEGTLELDTNPVENQIRPIALTRKNALFAGNEVGAENWAMLASLVATCKMSDVNPVDYIAATLRAILDGHPKSRIEELMPWRFDQPSSLAA